MMDFLNTKIGMVAAILTGSSAIGAAGWTAGDYLEIRPIIKKEFIPAMDQVQQIQQSVLLMQFQLLTEKRKYQPLTTQEMMQLCAIARVLGITVQGCA